MGLKKIALIGNPNAGKTSIFNQLTGLNQQVGNFPGVTVDKKTGKFKLENGDQVKLIDLPGTYSLVPRSKDEEVVFDLLNNKENADFPDAIIVVVDYSNLERNLLLFSQIYDLGIPTIMVANMVDLADKKGISVNFEKLKSHFNNIEIVCASAKKGIGIKELKSSIAKLPTTTNNPPFLEKAENSERTETSRRYQKIKEILRECDFNRSDQQTRKPISEKLDRIFVHPILGYLIFSIIMFLIFQAVYSIAEGPMDFIDNLFQSFSQNTKSALPDGVFTNLLAEGIIPGLGGVVIFIPQIVILFLFIVLLEESGYMSRVVFIMDRLMKPLGLSGKSVVPLVSSIACAIPAIMAARTINSWRDRIITIMVAPLVSCSARIPVYTLLIALIIPDQEILGIFNLKGLVLFALYALGFLFVVISALVFKWFIRSKEKSFLILELPDYKLPTVKNVLTTLWEKVRLFVWDAGRIILAVSIVLWAMASYGPEEKTNLAIEKIEIPSVENDITPEDYEKKIASVKLENSLIGIVGKFIEPAIKPLGYDWKIGISLITSFAAREVFVGSMATIYSVGEDFEEDSSLIDRMRSEVDAETGEKIYSLATGVSLMVFYVFAMQCMSTIAIVKRETNGWKWPMIQLTYMSALAYFGALIAFNLLS